MSNIASCYIIDQYKSVIFDWFCSALRNNKNEITHFRSGLKGTGDYMIAKCRIEFYKVILGISKQIKTTSDKNMISYLLNCCYWKITASDIEFLMRTGLVDTLKEGNNKDNIKLNPIK